VVDETRERGQSGTHGRTVARSHGRTVARSHGLEPRSVGRDTLSTPVPPLSARPRALNSAVR